MKQHKTMGVSETNGEKMKKIYFALIVFILFCFVSCKEAEEEILDEPGLYIKNISTENCFVKVELGYDMRGKELKPNDIWYFSQYSIFYGLARVTLLSPVEKTTSVYIHSKADEIAVYLEWNGTDFNEYEKKAALRSR